MFHRIIFLLLIVSTLSCNFNRCADCFESFSKQRFPECSKCRALNRFKIKNKHNIFFIMLERNSVNVHSNTRHCQHCKSQNRLAVQIDDFENFFDGLRLKPTRVSIVLNSNLYRNIVKYCILLSEVCMIKTVPHNTVSPQM